MTPYPHGQVFVSATYAPWSVDGEFLQWAAKAGPFTLVDHLRLWELWTLVRQSARLKAGCLVEVGCWRGGSAMVIGRAANLAKIPNNFYVFDTFSGIPRELVGPSDPFYKGGEHASNMTAEEVASRLTQSGIERFEVIRAIFPDKPHWTEPIRFAHIDVDVYESVKRCAEYIIPRLVTGGVTVFDDYGFRETPGVTKYVEELMKTHAVIHNLNGHAVLVKT